MSKRGRTGTPMIGIVRRRDLKAKPEPTDEALLRSAKAAATRASHQAAKLKRAAEADREARRTEP